MQLQQQLKAQKRPKTKFSKTSPQRKEYTVSLGTIVILIAILMLFGSFPTWGHSKNWGYGPSGGLGLVVIILLVLVLTGRL